MTTLKLGLHRLPAAEVVLIQTLLRLYGGEGSGRRWALSDAPPWDAVLVDDAAHDASGSAWDGLASAVLRIARIGEASKPDTIERPIRPDRLLRWLNAQSPVAKAVHAVPVESPAAAPDAFSDIRYRLKRWPPSSVLRNDARRVRLATLLSKRAFNANELAAVSQQPSVDCHAFLRLLRGTGLVEEAIAAPVTPVTPSQPAAAVSPAASAPARRPSRRLTRGLIGGLRRRLGL